MGISRNVSEIDGNLVENRKISPPPCILRPAEGVPLGIGYRRWGSKKTRMMGATGATKIYLQQCRYNAPT